jgi:hypothetical protein
MGISQLTDGLPHSDTRGSIRICRSPRFFAAYRVLLRLREPRHPPYALSYFLSLLVLKKFCYSSERHFLYQYRPVALYFSCVLFFQYVKDLSTSARPLRDVRTASAATRGIEPRPNYKL